MNKEIPATDWLVTIRLPSGHDKGVEHLFLEEGRFRNRGFDFPTSFFVKDTKSYRRWHIDFNDDLGFTSEDAIDDWIAETIPDGLSWERTEGHSWKIPPCEDF